MELKIKGKGNKIELVFEGSGTINDATALLKELKKEDSKFFSPSETAIEYSGLELSYREEMELFECIKKVFGENAQFTKKHKLSHSELIYSLNKDESLCKTVCKSLRSGEIAYSRGDIIIFGDVNAGAEVKASGNVIVTGALRGEVSITKKGYVYATYMQPTQIRIGNVISYNKKSENVGAALAREEKGEIILECL